MIGYRHKKNMITLRECCNAAQNCKKQVHFDQQPHLEAKELPTVEIGDYPAIYDLLHSDDLDW